MSDKTLENLTSGFKKFHEDNYVTDIERMKDLVENGQHPEALVIACGDSRTGPEIIFNTKPGEIFVVRHIAALVPPREELDDKNDTIASSIKYAVNHLNVQHIIIVGHTHCGGIKALADNLEDGAIGRWVKRAESVKNKAESKLRLSFNNESKSKLKDMEQGSIIWSMDNLRTFPSVKKAIETGKLQIHGWQFDLDKGNLLKYDTEERKFKFAVGNDNDKNLTNTKTIKIKHSNGCNC